MTADDEASDAAGTSLPPDAPTEAGKGTPNPTRIAVGGRIRTRWRPILLTALTVSAVGATAGLYFFQYRPDRQIDDAAAAQAVRAASDGAVAVLSYSSDSLDRDFAAAKAHLTGDFLTYYNKFTQEVVAPVVRDKHLVQKAVVMRAAASHIHPTTAEVLAFVNETVTGAEKKDPQITPAAVRMTLQKVDGNWLISKLDPVG